MSAIELFVAKSEEESRFNSTRQIPKDPPQPVTPDLARMADVIATLKLLVVGNSGAGKSR